MSSASPIKFIYFDVGGVVVLDFSKTNKWNQILDALRIPADKRSQFETLFDEYEGQICVGRSVDDFIHAAQTQLGIGFPQNYSMTADFVNRFEPNPKLSELISKLKHNYQVGLLTNMYPGMLDLIKHRNLMPDINWDVVIDSSVVKLRKPQPEIFKVAETGAGVQPHEILFVENSKSHLEAAASLGWQILAYDPADVEGSNQKLAKLLKAA